MAAAGLLIASQRRFVSADNSSSTVAPLFKISLAQWSLHKALFKGQIDNLDFPRESKRTYGIDAVEYVNQFFKDKAKDYDYLAQLNQRAADEGVTNVLIMCDGLGKLGDPDEKARTTAIENHFPWVEAAKRLGCHSIRVNAASKGSYEEQQKLAVDGLSRLSEYAAQLELNIIVENHGGLSSDGTWLAGVMKQINRSNAGTLPDFGSYNFCVKRGDLNLGDIESDCENQYDKYMNLTKTHEFHIYFIFFHIFAPQNQAQGPKWRRAWVPGRSLAAIWALGLVLGPKNMK